MSEISMDHWVKIKNGVISCDGEVIFSSKAAIDVFTKEAYNYIGISYPKFHKMDQLSKLGIIASELLLTGKSFSERTALVFSNASASLESDRNYQESIRDFPSPSLFVYTLPNIVLGEISIRHRLKSENAFFVDQAFNPALLLVYAKQLIVGKKADKVVCGWLNLHNAEYDVFLWLISEEGILKASDEQIRKIYDADYD